MIDFENRDRAFVIAEAGTCHVGQYEARGPTVLSRAETYAFAAASAGADAIKFQWFNPPIKDDMFCWIDGDEERSVRWVESALSLNDWMRVKHTAEAAGIVFLASAFQHSTVKWLVEMGLQATKVASRAAKDFPYGYAPPPYLVSDGMYADCPQSENVYRLQCEAKYPSTTHWDGHTFGFSDHSGNPIRAIEAISRGCRLVEVHFHLEPGHAGPDLPASLNFDELALVCKARDIFANQE